MPTNWNWTLILGIWGAATGTTTLVWNVVKGVHDRRRRVGVAANVAGIIGPGYRDPNDYLAVHVTNLSRTRDVEIRSAGAFETRTGRFATWRKTQGWLFMTEPALPKRLKPEETITLMTKFADGEIDHVLRWKRIAVFDSRGGQYRIRRSQLTTIQNWARKKQTAQAS